MKRLAAFLWLGLVLGACTDAGPTATEPETLSLSIVGPPHRTGPAGRELTDPVTVYLETTQKNKIVPAKGVTVNFVVTQGGGKVYAGAAVTDANGLASDYWTLGPAPGENALEVRVVAGDGTKNVYGTFTATGYLGLGFGAEQFALILPGGFQMGSTNGSTDEQPVHTVNITKAFYLQKTEVTQGQWRAVTGSNPSYFSACGDLCPMEGVSWDDIQSFLAALNTMDPGKNYRLPMEAEWEYACCAGTTGEYGGTGVLDQMGWYYDNSAVGGVPQTHPVAQKLPNAWGLYDMHGNVFEWVQDRYSETYYSVSPPNDPIGPETGTYRVLRGGSWNFNGYGARSAMRNADFHSFRYDYIGFRLARTP